MTLAWPRKDPDDVLDYGLDWSEWLAGDRIVASQWSVTSGDLTIDSSSFSDNQAKVWLSGGFANQYCRVLNRITTAAGRTKDQTVVLPIRSA